MVAIRKPFFVVPVDLGTVTPGGETAGFPGSNLKRLDSMGLRWQSATDGQRWVRGQFSSSQAIDFCAVLNVYAQPSSRIRVRLGNSQADVDGDSAPYDNGLTPAEIKQPDLTRNNTTGLYHSFQEMPAVVNATWWRIDSIGHSGVLSASAIILGKKIEPSRFYDKDFERGVDDLGSVDINRFGVADITPGTKLRTLNFTLSWLNETEYENTFGPLAEFVGSTSPVYCCFDPALTVWRTARTYMGYLRNSPFARGGAKPRNMSMEFQIRSLI